MLQSKKLLKGLPAGGRLLFLCFSFREYGKMINIMPMFRKFNKDFFRSWSNEMAYVLGFIFADGTVFKNKRGAFFLEITSTDLEVIDKIRKMIQSDHRVGVRESKKFGWKTSYRLQIGSKEMVKDLISFGVIQSKSLVVSFPEVPDKFLGHFVRGYFDGDGGVYFGKYRRKNRNNKFGWTFNTNFTSGSKKFLVSLLKAINKNVSEGLVYEKKGGYSLCFSRRNSVALFKLMYHNVSSEMFLERKYNKFLEAFKNLKYNIAGVV